MLQEPRARSAFLQVHILISMLWGCCDALEAVEDLAARLRRQLLCCLRPEAPTGDTVPATHRRRNDRRSCERHPAALPASREAAPGAAARRFVFLDVMPLSFALARYLPLQRLAQYRNAPDGVWSYIRNLRCHSAVGLRGASHAVMEAEDLQNRLSEIAAAAHRRRRL